MGVSCWSPVLQLTLTTTFSAAHTIVVTVFPNTACTTAGVVLNPLAVPDNTGAHIRACDFDFQRPL
jgi:hypothetical protein